MLNKLILKSTLKQGVLMGLGFCFYTCFMWLSKLDSSYLSIGQYFDMAIIILPIIMIIWAIQVANQLYPINFFQRMLVAIYVGAISELIYDPFLYVYHHYINPNWFSYVLNLKEIELKAANIPEDMIRETLLRMQSSNIAQSGLFRLSSVIPSVVIIPIFLALISLLFIRKSAK